MQALREDVTVGELVVEFVVEGGHKVGEDEWLGVFGLEEVGEVGSREGLLLVVEEVRAEGGQVGRVHQSVSVDALALVHPQFYQVVRLLYRVLFRLKHTLEHIRQVTYVEFVMEINSGLSESALDILMQTERRLDERSEQLLHIALELAEMFVQEGAENDEQGLRFGELDSLEPEVTL